MRLETAIGRRTRILKYIVPLRNLDSICDFSGYIRLASASCLRTEEASRVEDALY